MPHVTKPRNATRAQRGVTLVEMIVAIVVSGILVSITSFFVRTQINSYTDIATRTELSDAADTALRRMARDLQAALPNSVRVDASGQFLEFIPIKDGGRYRIQKAGDGSGNELDLSTAGDTFDVLGPPITATAGDQLVIYNLGISGANAYEGDNIRPLTPSASSNSLTFSGAAFPASLQPGSPLGRFHIVSTPVTYALDPANRTVWRYSGYNLQSAQPDNLATLDALPGVTKAAIAHHLDSTATNNYFTYSPGILQRNGIISIRLTLLANGENVHLQHQVNVFNTP